MGEEGARILEHEVRELVRRRGLDPIGDRAGLSSLVTDAVGDYATRASVGVVPPLADPEAAAQAVTDAVGGFGPLQPYLDDPEIEEVWLNAPSRTANPLSQQGVPTAHVTPLSHDRSARSPYPGYRVGGRVGDRDVRERCGSTRSAPGLHPARVPGLRALPHPAVCLHLLPGTRSPEHDGVGRRPSAIPLLRSCSGD